MKTDDLISALALDVPAASARQLERVLLLWMIPAALLALVGVLVWLGARSDLAVAVTGPTFWLKAAYTAALAGAGFWLLDRLGRPGARVMAPVILLTVILGAVILAAILELTALSPDARMAAMMGRSARECPTNLLVLSALAAPFVFIAARRFAPLRPGLAGGAAGLLTAGLAATIYGLHCTEHTAAFVAVWYTGGILLAALAGAVAGKVLLRW